MKKQIIKLTEQDIHNIIVETAQRMLNELDWKTYHNAYMKDKNPRRFNKFGKAANDAFNRDYGYSDGEGYQYTRMNHANTNSDFGKMSHLASSDKGERTSNNFVTGVGNNQDGDTRYYQRGNGGDSESYVDKPFSRDNKFARKLAKAHGEVDDFNKGNYEYQKGQGWVNKNKDGHDWHNYLDYNNGQ